MAESSSRSVAELKQKMSRSSDNCPLWRQRGQHLVLDLRDSTLVNESAVKFLAGCEADSIKLENCPAYIREWIERVKGRTRRRRTR
jgi:hypothetical protein